MLRDQYLRAHNGFDAVCDAVRRFNMNPPRLHTRINWHLAEPTQELNYWSGTTKHRVYNIHIINKNHFRLTYYNTAGRHKYIMARSAPKDRPKELQNKIKYPYFAITKSNTGFKIPKVFKTVSQAKLYAHTHNNFLKGRIHGKIFKCNFEHLSRPKKSQELDSLIS
ncbi:MAG: hypothetical protein K0U41_06855 [Gammaproteobacteria bacterium]|nr:hypothetical protein [Gammaproteobacteria bacterium]